MTPEENDPTAELLGGLIKDLTERVIFLEMQVNEVVNTAHRDVYAIGSALLGISLEIRKLRDRTLEQAIETSGIPTVLDEYIEQLTEGLYPNRKASDG